MRCALGFRLVALGIATGLAGVLTAGRALAVETRADVETDHVSAADDGGPRHVGVFLNPLPAGIGWLGGEVDAACSERVVVTIEGATRAYGIVGYGAALGVAVFSQGVAFHGWYVHPSVEWAHEAAFGISATAYGAAVRSGYEWTMLAGATLRLGAGVAYARTSVAGAGPTFDIGGVRPVLDADIGWVF